MINRKAEVFLLSDARLPPDLQLSKVIKDEDKKQKPIMNI